MLNNDYKTHSFTDNDWHNILIGYAILTIKIQYGTGKGDGVHPKAYHNVQHTEDVLNAAKQIGQLAAKNNKIHESEIKLISLAAAYHDIEQNMPSGVNEDESKSLVFRNMSAASVYSDNDMAKVCRMIDATKIIYSCGKTIQSATREYCSQILSDADMANLGQPSEIFWSRALALLGERKSKGTFTNSEIVIYAQDEIIFLENHEFYTDEAKELFPHKIANIEFLKNKINELTEGL